jgi:hypothetical protein
MAMMNRAVYDQFKELIMRQNARYEIEAKSKNFKEQAVKSVNSGTNQSYTSRTFFPFTIF